MTVPAVGCRCCGAGGGRELLFMASSFQYNGSWVGVRFFTEAEDGRGSCGAVRMLWYNTAYAYPHLNCVRTRCKGGFCFNCNELSETVESCQSVTQCVWGGAAVSCTRTLYKTSELCYTVWVQTTNSPYAYPTRSTRDTSGRYQLLPAVSTSCTAAATETRHTLAFTAEYDIYPAKHKKLRNTAVFLLLSVYNLIYL